MRPPIAALAGMFLSANLLGCGASATIPQPPANEKPGPPPGTSPEMTDTKKDGMTGGMMGPAMPATKPAKK